MTMVEVAWQLRDSVEILVGSEIEDPDNGWPYAEILQFLTAKPKRKTYIVAQEVVKRYIASYRDQDETVTQSAINTAATSEIIQALNHLAEELLSNLDENRKLIRWAWERTPRFYDDNYLDLYAFARKLGSKVASAVVERVMARTTQQRVNGDVYFRVVIFSGLRLVIWAEYRDP